MCLTETTLAQQLHHFVLVHLGRVESAQLDARPAQTRQRVKPEQAQRETETSSNIFSQRFAFFHSSVQHSCHTVLVLVVNQDDAH